MYQQNSYPIWVLNLARDEERRHFMTQQLQLYGANFAFIPAVDKLALSPTDLALYAEDAALACSGRALSPGEIGCALSHAKMWQRMVDENIPEVLILEDDILLSHALFALLANRHKFPATVEFINFATEAPQIPQGEFISDIYRLSAHQMDANMTSAYWITLAGANKLLAQVYPIRWPADTWTGRVYLTGLVSHGVYPRVALPRYDWESRIWQDDQHLYPTWYIVPRWRNLHHIVRSFWQGLKFSARIIGNALQNNVMRHT